MSRPASSRLYADVVHSIAGFLDVEDLHAAMCINRFWNHYMSTRTKRRGPNAPCMQLILQTKSRCVAIMNSKSDAIRKHITNVTYWTYSRLSDQEEQQLFAMFPGIPIGQIGPCICTHDIDLNCRWLMLKIFIVVLVFAMWCASL